MKKAELLIGGLCLLTILMSLIPVPGSVLWSSLTFFTMAFMYFYLGFALLNNIGFKQIFKKKSYAGMSALRLLGTIGAGISLVITLLGILFYLNIWPGAQIMLTFGISGIILVSIVCFFKHYKTSAKVYKNLLIRNAIIGGFGLLFTIIPDILIVDIKFRNQPAYLAAFKAAMADPNNSELWRKAEEVRRKESSNTP